MTPSGANELAMPKFESLEKLEKYRALGTTVSTLESLPVDVLQNIARQVDPSCELTARKEDLAKHLVGVALHLYNERSSKLIELEKCVDDLSRERLANR